MLNSHTSSHAASCHKEAAPLDSSRDSSDISDGDCGDVDEMIVISAQTQSRLNQLQTHAQQERTNYSCNDQQPVPTAQSIEAPVYKTWQTSQNTKENSQLQSSLKINNFNKPESPHNFQVAYKNLVKKLGKTEGGNLLVPEEDILKMENQHKVDVNAFTSKIAQFQERKRQKIQFLKDCLAEKEVEGCNFAPQLATKRKGDCQEKRNLEKFLEDQRRYDDMKKQKQSERKEDYVKFQDSQTIRSSFMNQKSRKILEQRNSRLNSVTREGNGFVSPVQRQPCTVKSSASKNKENAHQKRVSSISALKRDQSSNAVPFQPQITRKSKDMTRARPVEDILYEEAQIRKAKLAQKSKELMKQPEKHINVTSQKLVKQKFTREFCQCLHELFASKDENNEVPVILPKFINYLHLKQLMIKMGMISESAANSDSTERILLYDMWKALEGDLREEVSLDDVKVLIMGILRVHDNRRICIEPQYFTSNCFFNEKGQFCLSQEGLSHVQRHYDLLFCNRIQYLGRVQEAKKQQVVQEHTFKPQLSKASSALASSYRQKATTQFSQEKIRTYEWLTATTNKEEWRENAKEILQQEEMKECTFRPHVRARQESLNNRGSVQRRTNTECNSKTRSRDLVQNTGDVFNDLYKLGTQLKRQPKVDRTTEEIEYERNKDKCVFVPNKDRMMHTVETPASDIKVLDNKFVQKEVERMRRAREERERVKKFTERGIELKQQNSKSFLKSVMGANKGRPQSTINATYTSHQGQVSDRRSTQPSANHHYEQRQSECLNLPLNNEETVVQATQGKDEGMDTGKEEAETPLLYIDINLGEERQERVVVYDGDSAKDLASRFCEEHNLDEETQRQLEEQLDSQIRNVLGKIEEENDNSKLTN